MAGVKVKISAIDELSSAFDRMTSAGERALEMFERLQGTATGSFDTVNHEVESMAQTLNNATGYADAFSDAVDEMGSVSATEIEHLSDMEDVMDAITNQSTEAERAVSEFGETSERAGEQAEDFGDRSQGAVVGLEDVLATVGIVTALHEIGEAFMDASDKAAGFETSMAQVSTIADSTVLSTEQISSQIGKLSKDSAVFVNDIAEATYGAISASVDTADAVAFVAQANELAVGGFTSQATAVDVLTTAINAYQLSADRAGQISDYLVTTQNLGKTTVDQLASSIGMVIPSAAAFNVQMDNLSTAYAILTANGVQTAQSTTYLKSMFTELANTESEVAKVLQEETGQSFAELMEQGYSLGDVMEVLGDSVDGNTTAFMNMWSSMEAGSGAVSLYNSGAEKYAEVLGKMQQSAGATADAYEKMTNTTEFSSQRMENSFNNLSIAVGSDLNPAVSRFQNAIADVVDGFTDLIEEHPAISALLTGVTVGIGTVTFGITAYTAVTKIATVASAAFGTAVNTAIWPLTLAAAAIAGVTAAVVYFADEADAMEKIMDSLTVASQEQSAELDDLKQEYENAVDVYGETSEEALRLKYRFDELSESFENNKQTIEDFYAECDTLIEKGQQMMEEYEESNKALHENELRTQALIQRLDDLTESTDTSAGKQMEMEAIIAELNETVTGLNLSYEDLVENQEAALSSLRAYAEAQAKEERMQAQYQAYVDAIGMEAQYREQLEEATVENAAAQERYNAACEEYFEYANMVTQFDTSGMAGLGLIFSNEYKAMVAAEEAYNEAQSKVDGLTEQLNAQLEVQQECEQAWEEMTNAATEGTDTQIDSSTAVVEALGGVRTELEELVTAYDTTYTAAYDSLSGQMGLFESMKTESEQSVTDMQAALESQVEYLQLYTENLQKASEYGLSETLISSLSDGSAESAGQLDAIIDKIEELGGTTEGMSEDAQSFVDSFNSSFEQVETAKETWATSVAKMETDFSDAMDAIEKSMEETIDNLNMSDTATESAKYTMDAYVSEIEAGVARAQKALDSLTFADERLASGAYKKTWSMSEIPGTTAGVATILEGYAVGTSSAEPGLALVGENGPEIVDFSGGERVYTADETADILSGRGGNSDFYVAPADTEESSEVGRDKTITLKLEGSGEMKVGSGGMSKEAVVDILIENVKDVLMDILQQEILEEGDLSYEF